MKTHDVLNWIKEIHRQLDEKTQSSEGIVPIEQLREKLDLEVNREASKQEQLMSFINAYIRYSAPTSSKRFMNQLWSSTEPESLIGEHLSAALNTSMYTYEVAPVATLLEQSLVDYLSNKIWKQNCEGVMTSGGTASNMQALLTARNFKVKSSKGEGLQSLHHPLYVIASKEAHYSVKRSLNILGLGEDQLIEVEVNSSGQMTAEGVESAIEQVKAKSGQVLAVVATAGTTVRGAFDDLKGIGKLCEAQNVWFHVDGAYGASVILSESHSELVHGIEHADSVSWDFHKMLGLHLPAAFLFMKQKGQLAGALASGNDGYLFHDEDTMDLGKKSLQCGRRADVVKLWLSWKAKGEIGFQERIDSMFASARGLAELIEQNPKLELLETPQSINVCFRYRSEDGERYEHVIRETLKEQGSLIVNFSKNEEGPFFRVAVTRPDIDQNDWKDFLSQIIKQGEQL